MTLAIVAIETADGKAQINKITAKAMNITICVNDQYIDWQMWLPLSQVRIISTVEGEALVLPLWLAKEKGLTYRSYVCTEQELQENVARGVVSFVAF